MSAVQARLNNPESCICCGRRADGLAVGRPGKLGFYCIECGPDMAKVALALLASSGRPLDGVEQRVLERLAGEAVSGEESLTVPAAELPAFLAWAVKSFATGMRDEIAAGGPPF